MLLFTNGMAPEDAQIWQHPGLSILSSHIATKKK